MGMQILTAIDYFELPRSASAHFPPVKSLEHLYERHRLPLRRRGRFFFFFPIINTPGCSIDYVTVTRNDTRPSAREPMELDRYVFPIAGLSASPANLLRVYYECFCFAGMASIAAAGLEVHEAGRALRVQTETPHLVSMGSGRLSTAVTLHPLPEG